MHLALACTDKPLEEPPLRESSLASRMSRSKHGKEREGRCLRSPSPQPTYRSTTPSRFSGSESPKKGRPMGPRPVSPLPFVPTSPTINAMQLDIEDALESTLASMSPVKQPLSEIMDPPDLSLDDQCRPLPKTPTQLSRSTRIPFSPMEQTPKNKESSTGIVPLSIKKKTLTAPNSPLLPPNASPNGYSNKRARSPDEEIRTPLPRPIVEFRSLPVPEGFNTNLVRTAESTKDDVRAPSPYFWFCIENCCSSVRLFGL